MPKFDKDVETYLCDMVSGEVEAGKSNRDHETGIFENVVDMFEGKRPVKDYEWYSNLSLKEATSILLTDTSSAVNQYFQSRDFVEVKLEGDDSEDIPKSRAAKRCINKTLNNRRLHHYLKFTKSKNVNNMASHVYALCQWEQDVEIHQTGVDIEWQEGNVDESGYPAWQKVPKPIYNEFIKTDQFNYDVYDPRNVFVSEEYTYTIQDKKWITFRSEQSYEDLKALESQNGYINLDIIKELTKPSDTKTESESYHKGNIKNKNKKSPIKKMDLYLRFGKVWAVVEAKTADGLISNIKPGVNSDGTVLDDAVLVEAIVGTVVLGSTKILVRFDPTPYIDSKGRPYRPIVRGICYPHPTKDTGLGEGDLLLDMNAGLDDAFNLMFDKAKLATIPVTVSEKFAAEDNDSIYFEPGHNIAIEGGKNSIDMMDVKAELDGMLAMHSMMKNSTDQVVSTFPNTMGDMSGQKASQTATAFSGTEARASLRQNYKSLTFEYTFLTEFYWIILQMVWRFAKPKTAAKLMGEDVYSFDPDADYTYTPVSASIETENSKFRKVQLYQQLMATAMGFPNKNTPMVMNILWEMILDTLGPDVNRLKKVGFDESKESQLLAMQGSGGPGSQPSLDGGTSNQSGNPMSEGEIGAREAQYGT